MENATDLRGHTRKLKGIGTLEFKPINCPMTAAPQKEHIVNTGIVFQVITKH